MHPQLIKKDSVAQLVEQMTLNHWVQGSSPCEDTEVKRINRLKNMQLILFVYKFMKLLIRYITKHLLTLQVKIL